MTEPDSVSLILYIVSKVVFYWQNALYVNVIGYNA